MDNQIIFPLIVIILGFCYLFLAFFLHKKGKMYIAIFKIPIFARITKKSDKKSYWIIFGGHLIISFIIIGFGLFGLVGLFKMPRKKPYFYE